MTRETSASQREFENEDRGRVWVEHQGATLSLWILMGSSLLPGEVY